MKHSYSHVSTRPARVIPRTVEELRAEHSQWGERPARERAKLADQVAGIWERHGHPERCALFRDFAARLRRTRRA